MLGNDSSYEIKKMVQIYKALYYYISTIVGFRMRVKIFVVGTRRLPCSIFDEHGATKSLERVW